MRRDLHFKLFAKAVWHFTRLSCDLARRLLKVFRPIFETPRKVVSINMNTNDHKLNAHTPYSKGGRQSLAALAASRGIAFGSAINLQALSRDPAYVAAITSECAVIVPEGEMKWAVMEPRRGEPNLHAARSIETFATKHDLAMRGHCLIWHESLPVWLPKDISRSDGERYLFNRIVPVMRAFRKSVRSWDVVNEAVKPGASTDALRPSIWRRALGQSYIHDAFVIARATDAGAELVYNDFGFEHETSQGKEKRRAILHFLETLHKRGTPCDALGVQAHLSAHLPIDIYALGNFFARVSEMGYSILVTELDVDDSRLADDVALRDSKVAEVTTRFLEAALPTGEVKTIITWGLSDRHSWLNSAPYRRRASRTSARPLPLDEHLRDKPMLRAITSVLAEMPALNSEAGKQ